MVIWMLVIKNNLIYKIGRKIIHSFQIVGLKLRPKDVHIEFLTKVICRVKINMSLAKK